VSSKDNTHFVQAKVCQTMDKRFIVKIEGFHAKGHEEVELSPLFETAPEAMDWAYSRAKDCAIALSFCLEWSEPVFDEGMKGFNG